MTVPRSVLVGGSGFKAKSEPVRVRNRAVRRRHGVGGGGAPVNFGRGGGGGAARRGRRKKMFSKISEKISFYPQRFLMTFFF